MDQSGCEKLIRTGESAMAWKLPQRGLLRWTAFAVGLLLGLAAVSLSAQRSGSGYESTLLSIQQLIESADLESARAQLAKANREYPKNGGLENLLGVVEVQQGHAAAAERQFSQAITHSPKLISAYLNLGRLYLQMPASDGTAQAKALQVYERASRIAPSNAEANYQAARLLMMSKNYKASLEHLARMEEGKGGVTAALAIECADHAGLGQKDDTARTTAELASRPDLVEADAMEILPALRSANRADIAVQILSRVDAKAPLSATALRALGLALESDGKLDQARITLERAFTAESNSTALLVDLARIARTSKDYSRALGYLAHAREMEPANASLPYAFGLVALDLSLLGESRKALGEAVRLEPENAGYNFAMGTVSSFAQDPTQALPYLQKYHALRPADPAGILALGTTYFRAKDFTTASGWLEQASAFPGTAASAHYYLGRIARQQGRLEDARAQLQQAMNSKSGQPDMVAELGQVYLQMRNYPDAEKQFNEALRLNTDNYAANFGLLQLYAHTGDSRREAQSKRFQDLQTKNQAQYQEMMRIIEIRPEESSANEQR